MEKESIKEFFIPEKIQNAIEATTYNKKDLDVAFDQIIDTVKKLSPQQNDYGEKLEKIQKIIQEATKNIYDVIDTVLPAKKE